MQKDRSGRLSGRQVNENLWRPRLDDQDFDSIVRDAWPGQTVHYCSKVKSVRRPISNSIDTSFAVRFRRRGDRWPQATILRAALKTFRERERESEMEKGLTGQVLIKEDFGNVRFFNERKKCFEKIEEMKYNGIDGIFWWIILFHEAYYVM